MKIESVNTLLVLNDRNLVVAKIIGKDNVYFVTLSDRIVKVSSMPEAEKLIQECNEFSYHMGSIREVLGRMAGS